MHSSFMMTFTPSMGAFVSSLRGSDRGAGAVSLRNGQGESCTWHKARSLT